MSIPGSVNPLFLGAAAQAEGGYNIERSVRFNSSDSAYLSRTPASAGNRKTWTWAGWVKRSKVGTGEQALFNARSGATNPRWRFMFQDDKLLWDTNAFGSLTTAQLFRDPSAWFHLVLACDTTQATDTNRVKLYINGSQVTSFSSATYPSQNAEGSVNTTIPHDIGNEQANNIYFDGYLADIHFIDGQALDPTSFGEFDATTGVWVPIEYTGTYGTNGYHLDFADNASTTTIGYDAAGSNDWTANNLSVTAGAGNDSLVDVPTNGAQTDTGTGGEVRGNYCTMNPLDDINGATISNGNLDISMGVGARAQGTIAASSGKWYWEVTVNTSGNLNFAGGMYNQTTKNGYGYYGFDGRYYFPGGDSAYGSSYAATDTIGVALDLDSGKVFFSRNGTWQNSGNPATGTNPANSTTLPAGFYTPRIVHGAGTGSSSDSANFGQRPFAYTAPSGFKALNTANLPAPVVTKPSDLFDVKLYTGNGSTQTISGLGFSPDLVWIKNRTTGATSHVIQDVVRGATAYLLSNRTDAENTNTSNDWFRAFTSDGFTVAASTTGGTATSEWNANTASYAAWTWDAGTTTTTNTVGSISSQVRANASAGFSVVTYTGDGSAYPTGATVGHGLNVSPSLVIVKSRSTSSTNWPVYHSSVVATDHTALNTTAAAATGDAFNRIAPTSTVFSVGQTGGLSRTNENTSTYVAYCFAPVDGYSNFGSYTGNGSADGPFVYTGFRPRFILVKNTSVSGAWEIYDSARNTYNVMSLTLLPNASDAEINAGSGVRIDFLSNGFKWRDVGGSINGSGNTIIYAAFAEAPLNYARAR